MKKKNEILKEMATVINYSNSTSFSNIVMIYANVEELCSNEFLDDPVEASRATYFGNISDWSAQCRLDTECNIENVSDEVLEYEIEEAEGDILDDYFAAYGNDKLYKKYWEVENI